MKAEAEARAKKTALDEQIKSVLDENYILGSTAE